MNELIDIPYGFDNGIIAKTKGVLGGDIRVSGTRIGLDLLIAWVCQGKILLKSMVYQLIF